MCRAVSIQKGATSVNAWRATLETESIATVRACVRAVLCLEGWGRMNEQETCLRIWASLASICDAVKWAVWFFLKNLVGAWVLTVAPPDSWHLSFLPFWFFSSCLKCGNLSNWSICKACCCQWISPLSVCTLFSSYSRRERKSEGEEGSGGEAVELYWKSFPWI